MTFILAPYLHSPWVPVSPTDLSAVDDDERAKQVARAMAEACATEWRGEAPSSPPAQESDDPVQRLARAWGVAP